MYNICGISNTVSCLLPCTVQSLCFVVYRAHLVSFGYVYICDGAIMYVLCCMYLYMNVWCIHTYTCVASDSHSGLEGDQMVEEIVIIVQWE